jgi:hypothetical protein
LFSAGWEGIESREWAMAALRFATGGDENLIDPMAPVEGDHPIA